MSTEAIVALIAGLPAIIAAVATLLNGRRLKRVSERTKVIIAATAHGKNGPPLATKKKRKRVPKKPTLGAPELDPPGTYSPQSLL